MFSFIKAAIKEAEKLDSCAAGYQEAAGQTAVPSLAYAEWGMHLADLKDYKNALEKLETAVLMYGRNPKPCISLGIIYAQLKEYSRAEASLNEALKRDSQNAYAYSVLGSIYASQSKFEKAEELIKKALKLAPADAEIYLNYGILYAKMQKKYQAADMFEKSKFYNPLNMHNLFLLGVMYYELGKIKEAHAEFKQIEASSQGYKKLNYYLALCCNNENDYCKAAEYARRFIEEEPENPDGYLLAANALYNIDKKDELMKIYKLGEERKISSIEFFLSECLAAEKYMNIEKAKECALKALSIESSNSEALYHLGFCLNKEGKKDEALSCYDKALISNPCNICAVTESALIKYSKEEYEDASKQFIQAARLGCRYLYGLAANCCYKLGRLKKGCELYEKMLEYYPDSTDTLVNYTICLIAAGDYRNALRKIKKAADTGRKSAKVLTAYALAELKAGRYKSAEEKADTLLETNPDNTGAKMIKASALISGNRALEAAELLESIKNKAAASEIFIFLSYSAYKLLAAEAPSNYNKSMLNLYSEKMCGIDAEKTEKSGIISYITSN